MMIRGGGLGYTAADAARAVTPAEKGAAADFYNANVPAGQIRLAALTTGTEQSIYLHGQFLDFLRSLLQQPLNAQQKSLVDSSIAALTSRLSISRDRSIVDGQLVRAAGLQLVAEDAPMIRSTIPLSAELANMKRDLLAQLSAWGDPAVFAKAAADAAAYGKVAAAQALTPPSPSNLPSQFLPANVAKAAAAQLSLITKNTGSTNVGVTPITGSDTQTPQPQTASGLETLLTSQIGSTGIPWWYLIAGGGVALYFATKGKR